MPGHRHSTHRPSCENNAKEVRSKGAGEAGVLSRVILVKDAPIERLETKPGRVEQALLRSQVVDLGVQYAHPFVLHRSAS